VTNNPTLFAANPGWHAFFDQDGDVAEKTRRRIYDMVVAEKLQVQGFHYPFPGSAMSSRTAMATAWCRRGIRHLSPKSLDQRRARP
jgi:hypothetical protein